MYCVEFRGALRGKCGNLLKTVDYPPPRAGCGFCIAGPAAGLAKSWPACSRFCPPAIVTSAEIQRTGSTPRTRGLPPDKRERLDPLLRQNWSSASDSCRFPWRQRSADRHVPCNPESRRPQTKIDTMITLPYSLVIEATG